MTGTPDDALIASLARATVERAAPEELPLFGPTSEAFFEDPSRVGRQGGDQMLGFGVEAAMLLVTPAALSIAREVVTFVGDQLRARLRSEGEGAVQRALDRIFKRGSQNGGAPEPEVEDLTDEQLQQVRMLALEKARQLKLPADKAELLADSLVGSLATA